MPPISRVPPMPPRRRLGGARQAGRGWGRPSVPGRFRLGPVVVGLFLCLAGVLVYMWPRVHIVRLGYQVQTLEQQARDLVQEREQLRLEIASLKDPQRVYRVAIDQLGMAVPRHEQVFIVLHERKVR